MRRLLALVTVILMCVMTSCADVGEGEVKGGSLIQVKQLEFDAQYVRADYHDDTNYPVITAIRSQSELNEYFENNATDGNGKYDGEFFENKALVAVLLSEGSGSTRHKVNGVTKSEDGLAIEIECIVPEVGTCDMAAWHVFVEVDKSTLPTDTSDITVKHIGAPSISSDTSESKNPQATLTNENIILSNEDSVAAENILGGLNYDPKAMCNCLPEFKVAFEGSEVYGVHLTQGYARCDKGQAALTDEQTEQLTEIIERAVNYKIIK